MGSRMGSSGFQRVPHFRNSQFSLRLLSFSEWVPEWVPVGSTICESRKRTFCLRLPHKTQEIRDGFHWVPLFVQAGSESLARYSLREHQMPSIPQHLHCIAQALCTSSFKFSSHVLPLLLLCLLRQMLLERRLESCRSGLKKLIGNAFNLEFKWLWTSIDHGA